MRRRGWLCGLILLVGRPLAAQAPEGTIVGQVLDSATGAGIEGARVLLEGSGRVTLTSRTGGFTIAGLAPGRYRLQVAAVGYAPKELPDVALAGGDTVRVVVPARPASVALPGIVVTASRTPERVEDAPASVAVLQGDEVLRRNVTTIDGALAFVPGTTFNGSGQMDIRGSTGSAGGLGSRVLMLLDGHPVLSGDGGELIFEAMPLLDLDQVEVVKGATSALYGTNALGGVVNLVTTPIGDRPETAIRAHVGVYQVPGQYQFADGTLSTQGLTLQHSRTIDGVGARLAVGRETSDGFEQNGQYGRWFLRAKATAPAASRHPWDAYAVWSRNDSGDFLAWNSPSQPFEVQAGALGDRSVYRFLLAGATLTPIAGASTELRLSPYLNHNANQNYFTDNRDYHDATRAGTTAELSLYGGGRHRVILGVDGAGTHISSNFLGTPNIVDAAAFAQDEARLGGNLVATAGARFDWHDTDAGASERTLNPKLALVWRRSDRLSLRTSLARGYRAPSAIEQFVSTTQFGFQVVPNPELRGEHAWSAELGAAAQPSDRLRVEATLFQSEYRDLIGPAAAPGQFFVFQFRNVSRARVRGLDLAVHSSVVPDLLGVEASYLFLDDRDLDTHRALPYRSRHSVTGTAELLRGLAAVDLRWRSRVEEVLAYPLDPRGALTDVDLRLNYPVRGMVLQAKVGNLLQRIYPDVQERVPAPPRNLSLALYGVF